MPVEGWRAVPGVGLETAEQWVFSSQSLGILLIKTLMLSEYHPGFVIANYCSGRHCYTVKTVFGNEV